MLTRVISITKNNRNIDNYMNINLTLKIFELLKKLLIFKNILLNICLKVLY